MSTPQGAVDPGQRLEDRFLSLVRPRPRADGKPRRDVEDREYAEALLRWIRRLEERVIERPENLPLVREIQERLSEVINVAIHINAERHRINPHSGASMAECAAYLGISKQAASQRRQIGKRIVVVRVGAANAIPYSEAQREKEIIKRAESSAVTVLSEYRRKKVC